MRILSLRTLFLHIGMHKTGTTSLQIACARSRDPLAQRGFIYHRDQISDVNQNHFRLLAQDPTKMSLEKLIRDTLESGPRGDRHLISGEEISYMSDDEFSDLIDILEDYFDDIHVIAVVRKPLSYMSSAAQEILKEPFSTIDTLMHRPDVSPCYRARFEKALLKVGPNKCHFFLYDPRIIECLAQFMKMPIPLGVHYENRSMTLGVAILLNKAKLQASSRDNPIDTFDGVSRLIREFEKISVDHRKFEVPGEIACAWQERIRSDLSWLKTVWQVPESFFCETNTKICLSSFDV